MLFLCHWFTLPYLTEFLFNAVDYWCGGLLVFLNLYFFFKICSLFGQNFHPQMDKTFWNIYYTKFLHPCFILKWYSGLKNYFEIDNYNAALRWYTCTHNVYSLFNYIYNSKCALAAVLLPCLLPSLLPSLQPLFYFRVRGNKLSHRKLAINWQLGNFGLKQSQGLLIWKWWIKWCLICIFLYLTRLEAWISL